MRQITELEKNKEDSDEKIIASYKIRGFNVKIIRSNGKHYYLPETIFDFDEYTFLFSELVDMLYNMKDRLSNKILKLDELIKTISSIILSRLEKEQSTVDNKDIIVEIFTYKLIKLYKLMPLFYDNTINEIYIDSAKTAIYIDHQFFGRCETTIFLSEEEMQALISRIKLEHPISISYKNPSLKVELLSQYFHLRVAIDFPPLSPNGPTVNIRKIKANPFTLKDLINLGSFPPIIGAYLIETVNQRKNITIIGEPNAGKTTLANAIDLYTPKFWRKIVIEDAIESISQKGLGYKQTVIQVDSFDSNKSNYNKTSEILKLLHRSPDWIYLGEIQTREHTKAMFEALNSGLKGIQTAHSDSFEKLIRRWSNYGVSAEDFLSLEVIIVMERKITNDGKISRVIKEIFEINNKNSNNSSSFYQKIYDKAWKLTQIRESLRTNSILSKRYEQILLKERELQ
ncbi:MAG: Flp pilus assembly complex ATPase component TadA [Candidatus Heimdallarchaeum endolithica]|uniref:Flp pilus assembly complex ATPase component TadA n=1 Tax=Candidatus Heimdallarchaeum endolithica TaxID=2876572 RepID=A0A9Y1BPE4_9ARCH|nr:MAG: Flp pilus assembly complex ATPase component TadA [Candidatus Heimdallarchaeum endolithica]